MHVHVHVMHAICTCTCTCMCQHYVNIIHQTAYSIVAGISVWCVWRGGGGLVFSTLIKPSVYLLYQIRHQRSKPVSRSDLENCGLFVPYMYMHIVQVNQSVYQFTILPFYHSGDLAAQRTKYSILEDASSSLRGTCTVG